MLIRHDNYPEIFRSQYKSKGWKDARIHFAVNCASVGCPPLSKKVYTPENLNSQLDENIAKALKTKRHFYLEGSTLHLTYLTKWYKEDFEESFGTVQNFIAKYLTDESVRSKVKKVRISVILNTTRN